MTIKIIYALLILLMSLAGCSGDKVSRQPTAKLSSGSEGNLLLSPNNSPSDPLQVCSPAADLHTTDDEKEDEEARERRVYELTKSEFNSSASSLLVTLLFRNKELTTVQARAITDLLVEQLECPPEEILYTYYKFFSSSFLFCILSDSCTSAEERETIRSILEDRGEIIPES